MMNLPTVVETNMVQRAKNAHPAYKKKLYKKRQYKKKQAAVVPATVGKSTEITIALVYFAAITSAELITALISPMSGIIIHATLLLFLLVHAFLMDKHPSHKLYLALSLAPLIRIVSLSMPLSQFGDIQSYGIVAVPILVGIIVTVRILGYKPPDIGLTIYKLPLQLLVALSGLWLGLAEYGILKPEAPIPTLTGGEIFFSILIFIIATGFVEELAFRGVIQRAATEVLGGWGWIYAGALFSVLHIAYLSPAHWYLTLTIGLLFSWIVKKTGSLLGVTLAHGIANATLYLGIPSFL